MKPQTPFPKAQIIFPFIIGALALAFLACNEKSPTASAGGFEHEVTLTRDQACALSTDTTIGTDYHLFWPGYNLDHWQVYELQTATKFRNISATFYTGKGLALLCALDEAGYKIFF